MIANTVCRIKYYDIIAYYTTLYFWRGLLYRDNFIRFTKTNHYINIAKYMHANITTTPL